MIVRFQQTVVKINLYLISVQQGPNIYICYRHCQNIFINFLPCSVISMMKFLTDSAKVLKIHKYAQYDQPQMHWKINFYNGLGASISKWFKYKNRSPWKWNLIMVALNWKKYGIRCFCKYMGQALHWTDATKPAIIETALSWMSYTKLIIHNM